MQHTPFRFLLLARTTSLLGNAIAPVALAFAVLDLTGSARDLGFVVASRSVANVALLLFGGVLADRLPRSVLLVGSSLAAAVTQAVIAGLVLGAEPTVAMLAALSALNGAVAAISIPASSALTSETVPADQLQQANALLRLGLNGSAIIGASAGGVLIAVAGPGWGLLADACTYTLAAALFTGIRLPRPQPGAVTSGKAGLLSDLREGWIEFAARKWVWATVAQFAVVNAAFVGTVAVLGPVVADSTFGRGAYGLIFAAQALGYITAGVVAIHWQVKYPLRLGVALIACTALPAVALAEAPYLPLLITVSFAAGFAIEQFGIAWDLSLQRHIPPEKLARVYSYDAVGSFAAIPLGEAAVGPLAQAFGTELTLLGCAASILLATAIALTNHEVRDLPRFQPIVETPD